MKIGIGAGAGAAIGAILGGGDGAAKGAAIGGAGGTGVVLATRGDEVRRGPGADVTTRLTAPLTVRSQDLTSHLSDHVLERASDIARSIGGVQQRRRISSARVHAHDEQRRIEWRWRPQGQRSRPRRAISIAPRVR